MYAHVNIFIKACSLSMCENVMTTLTNMKETLSHVCQEISHRYMHKILRFRRTEKL